MLKPPSRIVYQDGDSPSGKAAVVSVKGGSDPAVCVALLGALKRAVMARSWLGSGAIVLMVSVPMVVCVLAVSASAAPAGTLQVCSSGCPYTQIATAVAAARSGDTIDVASGTYPGGFTIGVSMDLVGAGARATIIRGGGPAVTIGSPSGRITVSIAGVTITGGVAHSSPESALTFGRAGVLAAGGGVEITPHDIGNAAGTTAAATVTISNSVITGNRVAPGTAIPSPAGDDCPGGPCPFNEGRGGGIYNTGVLTLEHSSVTDNQASGVNGQGGGIFSTGGSSLTLIDSTVARNKALAPTAMVGRYAEGGGVFVDDHGALKVMHSLVSDNIVSLTNTLPLSVGGQVINTVANGGGIHVGDDAPTTIENTTITDNSVSASDPIGGANAINAAVQVGDGRLVMSDSVISHNRVTSTYGTSADTAPSAESFDQGGEGGTVGVSGGGTISHTQIVDNASTSTSPDGPTAENGGLNLFPPGSGPARLLTVQDSVISGNTVTASSPNGSASVQGVGILNTSLLKLINVQVHDNSGKATGKSGIAQGAGIWNGVSGPGTTVRLTLDHTVVTRNSLTASAGLDVQGAGLFTTSRVALTLSTISANTPDQCSGARC